MASISHPQTKSKVDQTRKWLNRIFDFTSTDDEPDKRIYWSLVSIPVLFFLVGVFYLCWNQCGLLKPYCSLCCALCTALCTKMEKEDLNPNYGTDLDEATSVAEVACVKVFIGSYFRQLLHDSWCDEWLITGKGHKSWVWERCCKWQPLSQLWGQANCHYSKIHFLMR